MLNLVSNLRHPNARAHKLKCSSVREVSCYQQREICITDISLLKALLPKVIERFWNNY